MYIACCIYCMLPFTGIKAVMLGVFLLGFVVCFFLNLPEYVLDLTVRCCCLCWKRSREPFVYWLLKPLPAKFQCVFIGLGSVQGRALKPVDGGGSGWPKHVPRSGWSPKGPANSHPSVGCGTERDRHCPARSGAGGDIRAQVSAFGGDHLPPLKAKRPIPVGTEGLRWKMFLNVSIVCPWKNKPEVLGRACLVLGQWRTSYTCPWAPVQISASRGT